MRRFAVVAVLALLSAALAIGATHAEDHRLHAADGCAVCRHVRQAPAVVDDVVALAPIWFSWRAAAAPAPAPRRAASRHARARGPPVV